MSDLFDTTAEWVLEQALTEADLLNTVHQLARRLVQGGVPVSRLAIGRGEMAPLFGAFDLRWDEKSDEVDVFLCRWGAFVNMDFKRTPFGLMLSDQAPDHMHVDLRDPDIRKKFSLFEQLHADGVTDYAAWVRQFEQDPHVLPNGETVYAGGSVSFCTKSPDGFSQDHIDGFERLLSPIHLFSRITASRFVMEKMHQTYLGRRTGNRILTGDTMRADGDTLDSVIFYSDLRNAGSQFRDLPQTEYLAALDTYYECTAEAVQDHGGEMLKFMGDGVLAIFPIKSDAAAAHMMAQAALSAAKQAFARASRIPDGPAFGVALHRGDVVYDKANLPSHLDFTAPGAAVALACRCETRSQSLDAPIVATCDFVKLLNIEPRDLGAHKLRGFDEPTKIWAYDPV